MSDGVDGLRLLVGLGFLFYAAVLDLRTRRVPNEVWVALAAAGLLLLSVDAFLLHRVQLLHLAVMLLVVAAAYALWFFHLLAGGADAKAVMALAVLAPLPVAWDLAGHAMPISPSPLPVAVVSLANAVLLLLVVPVGLAFYNLVRGDVRMPAMLLGYRMPLAAAAHRFVWIVEVAAADGTVRYAVFPSKRTPQAQEENLDRLRRMGRDRVWVTPKIPFMVPLLAGFLVAFTLGDVMFWVMGRLLGT